MKKILKNFNNFPFNFPNITLILFVVLAILSDILNIRWVLEGTFLFLALLSLNVLSFYVLVFIFTLHLLFFSIGSAIASLTIVYYLIYIRILRKKYTIPIFNTNILIMVLVVYFFYLYSNSIFSGRVYGFFNSPLSAGYFFAAVSTYVLLKYKNLFSFLIFIVSIFFGTLSGSRSSFILIISGILQNFFEINIIKKLKIFSITLFFLLIVVYYNEIIIDNFSGISRALSTNSASESGRMMSYIKWVNYDFPWYSPLIGIGRDNLGSMSLWFNSENPLVVESSFLTIISAYGIIGAIIVLLLLFYTLKSRSFIWIVFYIISCITVMMDSLSVSLPVLILLYAATNKNIKKGSENYDFYQISK